jgi:hypothetical protein
MVGEDVFSELYPIWHIHKGGPAHLTGSAPQTRSVVGLITTRLAAQSCSRRYSAASTRFLFPASLRFASTGFRNCPV